MSLRTDPPARALMVQGTASHVGKSLIVAGILRILAQDGWRAAPFKSQNMALNSLVTREGAEIGRAQGMQAEAAGIEPSADLNPILLKPTADSVAQVIVGGRPTGNFTAGEYHRKKPWLLKVVAESLDRLRAAHEVVVIEGAGSPAEVNLRDRDIANMAVAELADAPVLLVADIDRGGLFASVVGTVELLRPWERARLAGLLVNKFRGTRELLEPGLDFLRGRTELPVWGVIPHIPGLRLDQEDSVFLEAGGGGGRGVQGQRTGTESGTLNASGGGVLDLAVVALPHISNFTDFDPLERSPGVRLRYVGYPAELGERRPDAVFIPGTKNTVEDLLWMRSSGLAETLVALAGTGFPVVGICGGYQMLGRRIADPWRVESGRGAVDGLGLLAVDTELLPDKTTVRARAVIAAPRGIFGVPAGTELDGYEIHAGRTRAEGLCALRLRRQGGGPNGEPAGPGPLGGASAGDADGAWIEDGALDASGLVFGTYLHGLFESTPFRQGFLNFLRRRKGLAEVVETSHREAKEAEFDRLAAVLREHLDLGALYGALGLPGRKEGVATAGSAQGGVRVG